MDITTASIAMDFNKPSKMAGVTAATRIYVNKVILVLRLRTGTRTE